jgi:2-desacetyl-2-hydroxyethyl bacteriochlorophyllide A dehydrogenase
MKAWFLLGPREMELRDVADVAPGPGEALVRVGAVGICGSDAEAYRGKHPLPNYPRLPGHEFAGEVAATGAAWHGPAWGTRVAVDPALSCGRCYACRQGRRNCCDQVSIAGVHRPGALAEYVVCRAGQLVPIPDAMSFETAAMIETLSIGAQATGRAEVSAGDVVVVLGAGPIGLCCLMMARLRGARALVSEPLSWRRELAGELGAETVVDPGRGSVVEAVGRFSGGKGANVVLDATGEVEGAGSAFSLVGSAGRVVILTLTEEPIRVRPWQLVRQELTVLGSRLSLADFGELVSLAGSGRVPVEKLVTHRYEFGEAEAAFRAAAERPAGMVKAVVVSA